MTLGGKHLETLSPILNPFVPQNLPTLLGDWQLIYASQGTVVTRRLTFVSNNSWAGITLKKVWQRLSDRTVTKNINVTNGALIDLFLFGELKLQAQGRWMWDTDGKLAKVVFDSFSVQTSELFNHSSWSLPEIKIPVLEFLKNEAMWKTSYLNRDMRIGRGATGNLFIFRK
jgi:PAP_fibrillin